MKLLNIAILGILCSSTLLGQEKAIESHVKDSKQTTPAEQYSVSFQASDRRSPLAPPFFPIGAKFELKPQALPQLPGQNHLSGRIQVGPKEVMPDGIAVIFAQSDKSEPYDQLYVDLNLNGDLTDETPVSGRKKWVRDVWWSSFDSVMLQLRHSTQSDHVVDYPVSFWLTAESATSPPTIARFTRMGFLEGTFTRENQTYRVGACDANNDGILTADDSWGIAFVSGAKEVEKPLWRSVSDFNWSGQQAWRLVLEGTDGARGVVTVYDAGITREEDEANRDPLREDKLAVRAEKPVVFETDYEAAIARARELGRPCFIKFETEWCGSCKIMHEIVFTAKDVADAAQDVVCVKVDADKRKDLAQKYGVMGYPTGVFLDADQKENSRFTGYQSVKEMTELFRRVKKKH